jgi:FdhD protein
VELAEASGMTLAGFSRGTSLNVYAGQERVTLADPAVAGGAAAKAGR